MDWRVTYILLTLSTSISALATYYLESLFPVLPIMALAILLFLIRIRHSFSISQWLTTIILLGSGYRLFVFVWPPTSIGMDPSRVVSAIHRIMDSGAISSISGISFYSVAPLMHLYAVITGLITGISARWTTGVYALAVGITLPLAAAALVRSVGFDRQNDAVKIVALLTSFSAASLQYGYWIIPQTHAVILTSLVLIALPVYIIDKSLRSLLVILIIGVALIFTHKLSLLLTAVILLLVAAVTTINHYQHTSISFSPISIMALLFVILSSLQLLWLTVFGRDIILSSLVPLVEGFQHGITFNRAPSSPTAAVPSDMGLTRLLSRNGNWLTLGGVAGLSWVAISQTQQIRFRPILLGAGVVAGGLLTVSTLVPSTVALSRVLFYTEIIFCVLISVGLNLNTKQNFWSRSAIGRFKSIIPVPIVIIILVSQLASTFAVPAYPNTPRFYLTDSEAEGKQFINENVPKPVHADFYFVYQVPNVDRTNAPYVTGLPKDTDQYVVVSSGFSNATLIHDQPGYVAIRTNIEVYRLRGGSFRLLWNPTSEFAANTSYNVIYSSEDVEIYSRTNLASNNNTAYELSQYRYTDVR